MMNFLEVFKMLKGNPKEMVGKMISNNNANPIISNLMEMAQKGDTKGVETFARNMCKDRGIDFDKELSNFKSQFPK